MRFHLVYVNICAAMAELSSCDRKLLAQKAASTYYLFLHKGSLLTPGLALLQKPSLALTHLRSSCVSGVGSNIIISTLQSRKLRNSGVKQISQSPTDNNCCG